MLKLNRLTETERKHFAKLIGENHDVIVGVAQKFARANPKNIGDFYDYYQEACLVLLPAHKGYDPSKGQWSTYLNTVLNNQLSKFSLLWNSPLSVNTNAVKLCMRIYHLESVGKDKEEILAELDITNDRYLEVRNLLRRECLSASKPENNQNMERIKEIRASLEGEELKIFELCLQEMTVMAMSQIMGYGHETMRRKVKRLLNKIREEYQ